MVDPINDLAGEWTAFRDDVRAIDGIADLFRKYSVTAVLNRVCALDCGFASEISDWECRWWARHGEDSMGVNAALEP